MNLAELASEDLARAQCYAIIGRLLYGGPDAGLAAYIADEPGNDEAVPLAQAWQALQGACRDADLAQVGLEYDDLFVGVGKAPVTLYTSGYAAPHAPDRHLLALRNRLDDLGLARRATAGETEDHIAALCDAMRCLIENGHGVDAERRFFFEFVAPAVEPLCAAIEADGRSPFYRTVARFLQSFYEVERAGFELLGTSD
ncbi:MAG: molecular chaperone [Rhodospirillaceae bacterium]